MAAFGGHGRLEETNVRVITNRGHQDIGFPRHVANFEEVLSSFSCHKIRLFSKSAAYLKFRHSLTVLQGKSKTPLLTSPLAGRETVVEKNSCPEKFVALPAGEGLGVGFNRLGQGFD